MNRNHYYNPTHTDRSLCGYLVEMRRFDQKAPMKITTKIEEVSCLVCLKKATEHLTAKLNSKL